jgi:hypothetical protein
LPEKYFREVWIAALVSKPQRTLEPGENGRFGQKGEFAGGQGLVRF